MRFKPESFWTIVTCYNERKLFKTYKLPTSRSFYLIFPGFSWLETTKNEIRNKGALCVKESWWAGLQGRTRHVTLCWPFPCFLRFCFTSFLLPWVFTSLLELIVKLNFPVCIHISNLKWVENIYTQVDGNRKKGVVTVRFTVHCFFNFWKLKHLHLHILEMNCGFHLLDIYCLGTTKLYMHSVLFNFDLPCRLISPS